MSTIANPAATGAATAGAAAAATPSKLNADFTMFLKLLTTQMKNQDPLNPTDTAQYTQQLVQYSQVEQSMAQTATLKDILAKINATGLSDHAALIGHMVEVSGGTATLDAAGARWRFDAASTPVTGTARIVDEAGTVVRTIDLAAGPAGLKRSGEIAWDGTTTDGSAARPGNYTVQIDLADANGGAIATAIHGRVHVDAVSADATGTTLRSGTFAAPISSITSILG